MGLDSTLYVRGEHIEKDVYWRKANFIHRYFTEGWEERGYEDDNCTDFMVTVNDIEQLRDLCKEVLEDNSKAPELLPTQNGFFFGSTDYDEWYFTDVEYTKQEMDNLLKCDIENADMWYSAWY